MYRREAVRRLREHFRIHYDGKPTPYLDEAVEMACDALDRVDQIIEKFGSFDRAMAAENVVHCERCAFYDPENLLCGRYGLEKPIITLREGYCSCGMDKGISNDLMETCRANGGGRTPGYIMTADEMSSVNVDELPEELIATFVDALATYVKTVQEAATYLYGDNPTPEQVEATIYAMCMRHEKRLENKLGVPLP